MYPLIGASASITSIAGQLGVVEKLKRKLVKQPDPASAKLETVLIELSKIHSALTGVVDEYLGLWLLPDSDNKSWRQEIVKLREFATGGHEAEMRKAKGDCSKIGSIYDAYLSPWFARVLNADENESLRILFLHLREIDSTMIDAIEATASWLTEHASATLDLVDSEDYAGADRRIQNAWREWRPTAVAIGKSMNTMYDLRADFIEASGAL